MNTCVCPSQQHRNTRAEEARDERPGLSRTEERVSGNASLTCTQWPEEQEVNEKETKKMGKLFCDRNATLDYRTRLDYVCLKACKQRDSISCDRVSGLLVLSGVLPASTAFILCLCVCVLAVSGTFAVAFTALLAGTGRQRLEEEEGRSSTGK